MEGWTKIEGAASYCGMSVRTIRGWLKKGLKHSRLPSGTILIRYGAIDAFLGSHEVEGDQVSRIVDEIEDEL